MTPKITIYSEQNKNLDQAADALESMQMDCPYNRPDYMTLLATHLYRDGRLHVFFFRSDNGQVYYPFFKRPLKTIARIPEPFHKYHDIIGSWYFGGPVTAVFTDRHRLLDEYSAAFSDFCATENIVAEFIRFDPALENHLFSSGYHEVTLNRDTVYIDLGQPYEQIWNSYSGRCRTAVRKALKNDIRVSEHVTAGRIEAFARIYQSEMERKADSRHYFFSSRFFTDLITALPGRFKFFFAFHKDRLCGGTLVYYSRKIAYDYLMATDVDSWKYQPNNLLLDTAVRWAGSRGIAVFDLMGGRPGVFRFKSSFSDLRRPFFTGKKIHMPNIYAKVAQLTRELKKEAYQPDFFPVYRQLED
jgi:hypothetical protein